MAATSTMLPLGTELPAFKLTDVRTGEQVSSDDLGQHALVVMFICNHCPYVKLIQQGLVQFGLDYEDKAVDIVGVASNDALTHPEDGPEELARVADELGYRFPLLYDETQEVARAFTAACTPDFFLFDSDRRLVYRGQFDDARPSNGVEVTGKDLRRAIDTLISGEAVPAEQRPSMGCSIKWKSEGLSIR
ncbi:MAG: thioredoxin family protein [Acidimicrobiia bacterium]